MEAKDVVWRTPSRGEFTFNEMVDNIKRYVREESNIEHQIIVGADSQSFRVNDTTKYVIVVIVRRPGKGAQYYVAAEKKPIAKSLRQKIWYEVMSLYQTLKVIEEEIKDLGIEIIPHVDVGEDGDTSALIKEVTSIFLAEGYKVQIKPYSYGASGVANKHSK